MSEYGKLNFSVAFNPTSAFPLDARSYFDSLAAATAAAGTAEEVGSSNTVYHYGETVAVVENGAASLYIIQPDKTLSPVGEKIAFDTKAFGTTADGKVTLAGFAAATAGAQLTKGADGSLSWVKPDTTTVDGLNTAVASLRSDLDDLSDTVDSKANAADVYTKTEVDGKLGGVFHYKGNAVSMSNLESGTHQVGDVYNILAGNEDGSVKAGDNVAWTGTEWDVLAGTVDLSGYATAADMNVRLMRKVDVVDGKGLSSNDFTNTLLEKLNIISDGAQVNAIDGVSDEFEISAIGKVLSVKTIAQGKVTGLTDTLANKVDKVTGKGLSSNDFTDTLLAKLNGIDAGANANVLEVVKLAGTALAISEKSVNIPVATAGALGVVKASAAENGVDVGADGAMSVRSLNVSKLVQSNGDVLVLDGGRAV